MSSGATDVDVADEIEAIAAGEIRAIRLLLEQPDTRLDDSTLDRLLKLQELVNCARAEFRDQEKYVVWLKKAGR